MSQIEIEYATEDVPYWNYAYARIAITEDGYLYSYGTDSSYMIRKNEIDVWHIPNNVLGKVLNNVLEQISSTCGRIVDLHDAYYSAGSREEQDDIELELMSLHEHVDSLIEYEISDYDDARATIFRANSEVMTDWFINGESPEEIEDYVSQKLVHEDTWVYFPDYPESYKDVAEKYYNK